MAWGVNCFQIQTVDFDRLAVVDLDRDTFGLGILSHHGRATEPVPQPAKGGDMVGVHVGVYRQDQLEIEFPYQLEMVANSRAQDRVTALRRRYGRRVSTCRCWTDDRTVDERSWLFL